MISLYIYGKFCQLPAPAEKFGYDEALLVKSTGNLILWLCSYVKCLFLCQQMSKARMWRQRGLLFAE